MDRLVLKSLFMLVWLFIICKIFLGNYSYETGRIDNTLITH